MDGSGQGIQKAGSDRGSSEDGSSLQVRVEGNIDRPHDRNLNAPETLICPQCQTKLVMANIDFVNDDGTPLVFQYECPECGFQGEERDVDLQEFVGILSLIDEEEFV